ncbi:SPOSA6832_02957, partial [Sporobolomyces salmonicolor]
MGYRFSLSILGLVLLAAFLAWHYRNLWIEYLPRSMSSRLRHYEALSFEDAAEQGFSTTNFDLSGNLAGDSRAGLDEQTLTEVRRIMEQQQIGFDEARVVHMNRMFKRNGIGADGLPIDRKAITSLS